MRQILPQLRYLDGVCIHGHEGDEQDEGDGDEYDNDDDSGDHMPTGRDVQFPLSNAAPLLPPHMLMPPVPPLPFGDMPVPLPNMAQPQLPFNFHPFPSSGFPLPLLPPAPSSAFPFPFHQQTSSVDHAAGSAGPISVPPLPFGFPGNSSTATAIPPFDRLRPIGKTATTDAATVRIAVRKQPLPTMPTSATSSSSTAALSAAPPSVTSSSFPSSSASSSLPQSSSSSLASTPRIDSVVERCYAAAAARAASKAAGALRVTSSSTPHAVAAASSVNAPASPTAKTGAAAAAGPDRQNMVGRPAALQSNQAMTAAAAFDPAPVWTGPSSSIHLFSDALPPPYHSPTCCFSFCFLCALTRRH